MFVFLLSLWVIYTLSKLAKLWMALNSDPVYLPSGQINLHEIIKRAQIIKDCAGGKDAF